MKNRSTRDPTEPAWSRIFRQGTAALRFDWSSSSLCFPSSQDVPHICSPTASLLFHSNLSPHPSIHKAVETIFFSFYQFCLCSPVPFCLSRWYLLQGRNPNLFSALQNFQVLEGFEWKRKESWHAFGFLKEDAVSSPASCSGHRAAAVLPFILGLYLHWMPNIRQPRSWSALKYYSKKCSYKYDSI